MTRTETTAALTTAESTTAQLTTAQLTRVGRSRVDAARPRLSSSSVDLVERAHDSLLSAVRAGTPGERYVAAHLAALRGAAALLAVRGRPNPRTGPRSVWEVLPRIAPELEEWAAFFDAGASRRAAVEAGRDEMVSSRDADDLVRDAETFLVLVESTLGLSRHHAGTTARSRCRPAL